MSTVCGRPQGGGGPTHVDACGQRGQKRHKWMAPYDNVESLRNCHSSTQNETRITSISHRFVTKFAMSKFLEQQPSAGLQLIHERDESEGCPKSSPGQAQVLFP